MHTRTIWPNHCNKKTQKIAEQRENKTEDQRETPSVEDKRTNRIKWKRRPNEQPFYTQEPFFMLINVQTELTQ